MTGFVLTEGNPPPEGAEAVWFDSGGRRVRAMFAPAPAGRPARGTALVFPGRTEFIEKYFEVCRDLQARGFAVACFDWPGQGLSDRLAPDPLTGHVPDFDVFVEALRAGLARLEGRLPPPVVLVAHSMGGAIGFEAIRRRVIAPVCAAFSAPMLGLKAPPLARVSLTLAGWLGASQRRARRPGPPETFETNHLTHDRRRWQVYRDCIAAEPRLALGEPSIGWVNASLAVFGRFARPDAFRHAADTPLLIASAGKERLVDNAAHAAMVKRFPRARGLELPDAYHEILMETDPVRGRFMEALDGLLAGSGV